MRWRIFPLALLAGFLALSACAAREEALPQEGPAPAAPQAAPAAQPAWEQEWERVLAAAKREGRVTIMGPAGDLPRRALEAFEKRYGINVEYMGARGAEQTARINTERAAGQYLWDVALGGLTHWVPIMDEALAPIPPALILPEVKDPKSWWEGQLYFLDNDPRTLAMSLQTSSPVFINTKLVRPEELKSFKELLDPKWKGKILSGDPRITGAPLSHYTFLYLHPDLGPDFIRGLGRQGVSLNRDDRQVFEWLAQGKFPIVVGGGRSRALPLIRQGLPILNLDPRGLREGTYLAVGQGHLFLFNRPAHPNAAKLFINWILTKEGQAAWFPSLGIPSLRVDVANDWVEPWELPQKGYVRMVGAEEERIRAKVRAFLMAADVFGP